MSRSLTLFFILITLILIQPTISYRTHSPIYRSQQILAYPSSSSSSSSRRILEDSADNTKVTEPIIPIATANTSTTPFTPTPSTPVVESPAVAASTVTESSAPIIPASSSESASDGSGVAVTPAPSIVSDPSSSSSHAVSTGEHSKSVAEFGHHHDAITNHDTTHNTITTEPIIIPQSEVAPDVIATQKPSDETSGVVIVEETQQSSLSVPTLTPASAVEIEHAVASLNSEGVKPDDKDSEAKFSTSESAPIGGVRLIQDIITGELKAVIPNSPPTQSGSPSAPASSSSSEQLSSVAAAALGHGLGGVGHDSVINSDASTSPSASLIMNPHLIRLRDKKQKHRSVRHERHTPTDVSDRVYHHDPSQSFGLPPLPRDNENASPMHISIGTNVNTSDVVHDDTTQPEWDDTTMIPTQNGMMRISMIHDFTDFYLFRTEPTSNSTQSNSRRRTITSLKPYVFVNDTEVLRVQVAAWGNRPIASIPLLPDLPSRLSHRSHQDRDVIDYLKSHKHLFSLQYTCHRAGLVLVTVILRCNELRVGRRNVNEIKWSYLKQCSTPGEAIKRTRVVSERDENDREIARTIHTEVTPERNIEGNTPFPGLSVGSRNNLSDIIEHGETKEPWSLSIPTKPTPTIDADTTPTLYTYGPEVEGTKFWLRYLEAKNSQSEGTSINLTVNRAIVLVDDPLILLVDESGELTETSTVLRGGRTYTLQLTFTCKKSGSSIVTVAFSFPSSTDGGGKMSFSFRKECTGLSVGDGAIMNGIDIWLNQDSLARRPEVVFNGVVEPEWRPLQNLSMEILTDRSALASAEETTAVFFVKLRDKHHDVEYDMPIIDSYSLVGDVLMRPTIAGSIMESNKLRSNQARYIIVTFNCLKAGDGVVTIKFPFRPTGSIQFNMRKRCETDTDEQLLRAKEALNNEYSTGAQLKPLPGINIGHTIDQSNVVRNGIPAPYYHLIDTPDHLLSLGKKYPFVTFFLSKNVTYPDAKDIRFGRPELISTADIARPVWSGLGASGGLVSDNEYSTISITFHCFTAGTTTLTLIIPLVADEWLNAQNQPVSIPPAREDPIKISFNKECPSAEEESIIGMGGVGISGFSVGMSATSSELVYNGFPQPMYFGQRSKPKPDWDSIIQPDTIDSTTIYFHYNSRTGLENKLIGREVLFQAPIIITHNPTARPTIAGEAATGGILVRDGPALPLDITYNCRYAGLAVFTLVIPVIPHGQISITIPKLCTGGASPHGAKITGLHVGTTPMGSEVVANGLTTPSYVAYATKKYQEHMVGPNEEMTTFYIRKEGATVRAIEPMIYAQKPIVNVRLTHALLVNSSVVDDDVDGDEIEINDEVGMINVTYACVHDGHTDITISLNLLPVGQLQWTFEKRCAESSSIVDDESNYLTSHIDSIISPGFALDTEYQKYNGAKDTRPIYGPSPRPIDVGAPIPAEASIRTQDDDVNGGMIDVDNAVSPVDYNPHSSFDASDASSRSSLLATSLSSFRIGTGKTGSLASDVFERSLATPRYQMKNRHAKSLDISKYAVIKPDIDVSTFYLSTTSHIPLQYGKPRIQLDAAHRQYLAPTLDGPGSVPSTMTSLDSPRRLDIHYNCHSGGVFAVGIHIPIGDQWSIFRVIKICPTHEHELNQEFYIWTAGRIMWLIAFIVASIGVAIVVRWFKRAAEQRKIVGNSNALYAPVQTVEQEER